MCSLCRNTKLVVEIRLNYERYGVTTLYYFEYCRNEEDKIIEVKRVEELPFLKSDPYEYSDGLSDQLTDDSLGDW